MTVQIQVRRDTAANFTSANKTYASGEPCLETDTGFVKIGDGATAWSSLPYFQAAAASAVQLEGSPVASRPAIDYRGRGVVATDDTAGSRVRVRVLDEVCWAHDSRFSSGAKGDGSTDDTAAIKAAVSAAAAAVPVSGAGLMHEVALKPGDYRIGAGQLVLPGSVSLKGYGARLVATSSGTLIKLQGTHNEVKDLSVSGGGVGVGANGIVVDDGARYCNVEHVSFDQFAGRALLVKSGAQTWGHWISRLVAQNCLLDASGLAAHTGVVEIGGTDNYIADLEVTASRSSASSANLYVAAVMLTGSNHFARDLIGEISDIGFVINCTHLRAHGLRADLNRGHGFKILGGTGTLSGCHSLSNSQDGDGQYYGFWTPSTAAASFHFVGCLNESDNSSIRPSYGFLDEQSSFQNRNQYVACRSTAHTAYEFFTGDYAGGLWQSAPTPFTPVAAFGASTSVSADAYGDRMVLSNTSASNLTTLQFGRPGRRVTLIGDGFTTLKHGTGTGSTPGATNLRLASGTDTLAAANKAYSFVFNNGVWVQDGASLKAPSWQDLTLGSNITGLSGAATPGCSLDNSGFVHLRGALSATGATVAGTGVLATLPAGMRPASKVQVAAFNSGVNYSGDLIVNTDGTIAYYQALASGNFVTLDSITFPVA